jgi:hypothetical protein
MILLSSCSWEQLIRVKDLQRVKEVLQGEMSVRCWSLCAVGEGGRQNGAQSPFCYMVHTWTHGEFHTTSPPYKIRCWCQVASEYTSVCFLLVMSADDPMRTQDSRDFCPPPGSLVHLILWTPHKPVSKLLTPTSSNLSIFDFWLGKNLWNTHTYFLSLP